MHQLPCQIPFMSNRLGQYMFLIPDSLFIIQMEAEEGELGFSTFLYVRTGSNDMGGSVWPDMSRFVTGSRRVCCGAAVHFVGEGGWMQGVEGIAPH